MTDTIDLTIDSKYELVDEVAAASRRASTRMGFDEETSGWVELAVREAVINAIKHGNKQARDKQVEVRFVIGHENLTVYVRDRGAGFDVSETPDPLNPKNLLNPDGRGIFFMRTFMDQIEYSTHPEGGCVVRMLKLKK
jgi:serine/threonine-protein kinase RsbW